MTKFRKHPRSNIRIALDKLRPFEGCAPVVLQEFLMKLNLTETNDQVWELLLGLCHSVGQKYVAYGFTYYKSHKEADLVLWSNLPDDWKDWVESVEDMTYVDYGRMHIWAKLTSFVQGIEFMDMYEEVGLLSPQYNKTLLKLAEFGWRSGIFVPLRSTIKQELGGISFGGEMSRTEFTEFVSEHGWTLNVASMHAHNAFISNLWQEEADVYGLTKRQISFLRLSANGLEAKEIAHAWGTSIQAVTKVRRAICSRFGTASKLGMMAKAVRLDLLTEKDFEVDRNMSTSWK